MYADVGPIRRSGDPARFAFCRPRRVYLDEQRITTNIYTNRGGACNQLALARARASTNEMVCDGEQREQRLILCVRSARVCVCTEVVASGYSL